MLYDVLIIGGGCTGTMTARLLSRYRLKVALCEAGFDVAWGASRANSAISHAGYDCVPGTLKARLNVRGTQLMPEVCRELGEPYRRIGSHVLAFDEEDVAHIKMLYDRGVANGVPGMKILGHDEVLAMEPNVSDKVVASLWAPTAGIISTYGLTIAAADNAALNGAKIMLGFRVGEITRREDHWDVSDGKTTVSARYLVNAAGVYAPEIARLMGEVDFPVQSKPSRGEYIVMDHQYASMAHSTLFVCPSAKGKGILVSPTVHGNLITGPNARPSDEEDKATTAEGLEEIRAGGRRIMPNLPLGGTIRTFAGVRPNANLSDFYVQASRQLPCVVHAAAMSSPGLASSPATAEYVTELLGQIGLELRMKEHYYTGRRAWGNPVRFADMTDDQRREAIRQNPAYGRVICRCETVTEGDLLDAMEAPVPATTVDMLKHRLRAGMGRCQGGFCSPRVAELLAEHFGIPLSDVTKMGGESFVVCPREESEARV